MDKINIGLFFLQNKKDNTAKERSISEVTCSNPIIAVPDGNSLIFLLSNTKTKKQTMESAGPEKSPYTGGSNQNEAGNKYQYHYSQFSVASSPTTSTATRLGENNDIDRKKISCNSCRQRKIKCDRGNPCNQCASSFYGMVEIPS